MSKSRFKVGLLGAGFILEAHAKAIKAIPGVEIVAVCDLSPGVAQKAALAFDIPETYTSLDEMLETDIDVVHVLLPPDLHIDVATQVVESGRHVFIEKPMGLDAQKCQMLVDLARTRQVKVAVNHNFLFLPSYERLRQQATDGTLGKLDQVTINWLYPLGLIQSGPFNNWMLREPQNLIYELGPHLVAYMLDLCGTVDHLQARNFRPIDLPGGNRVYRKWHVHAEGGDVGIDLDLAVTPGYTDRSVSARGYAATAKCDFDRDLYYRDEPRGHGVLFDNFFTAMSLARQLSVNAVSNLTRAIVGTLKKSSNSNPFSESVARSIRAYYETIDGELDPRLDGQFGVQVIETIERIISEASFEPATNIDQPTTVLSAVKKPTILVIGGTGFIGKCLVRMLTEKGHGVRVISRSINSGQIALAGLPVELMQGELSDVAFLDNAMSGIEVIYDLAKAEGSKWDDYYTNDVLVTRAIAERAIANKIKRFIYTGTIDSYYSANKDDVITGDTPLDPKIKTRNHYARSKAACEELLMDLHKNQALPLVILRPGIVIGKGCPPAHWGVGMFQSNTRVQYWGDGKNKLPLVLVDDVAEALLLSLDKPGIEGRTFLLTDNLQLSGREYVDVVSKASGVKLRANSVPIWKLFMTDAMKELAKYLIKHPNRRMPSYRDWDSRSHRAQYDSAKTREALGWESAGTKNGLIERGIVPAVREFMD